MMIKLGFLIYPRLHICPNKGAKRQNFCIVTKFHWFIKLEAKEWRTTIHCNADWRSWEEEAGGCDACPWKSDWRENKCKCLREKQECGVNETSREEREREVAVGRVHWPFFSNSLSAIIRLGPLWWVSSLIKTTLLQYILSWSHKAICQDLCLNKGHDLFFKKK